GLAERHERQRRGDHGADATVLAKTGRAVGRTPRFLLAFLALAALASTGIFPAGLTPRIGDAATAMITVALAAIGLSIDLAELRRTGMRPIVLGAGLWVTVSLLSLGMQALGFGS
ncbi:MAG: putative sulfate exporter family transporter, partial [Actinobacteria bacterium]|nr:putative sulfate exporter family transporter [Actinomycetota bacterium]